MEFSSRHKRRNPFEVRHWIIILNSYIIIGFRAETVSFDDSLLTFSTQLNFYAINGRADALKMSHRTMYETSANNRQMTGTSL